LSVAGRRRVGVAVLYRTRRIEPIGGGFGGGREAAGGSVVDRYDQAIKSMRWMSWRQEAMKDVVACEKPRGAGKQALILGCLNGETHPQGYLHLNA